MPAFLISLLTWFAAGLVSRMLIATGLGLFTYSQVQNAFNKFEQYLLQNLSALPTDVVSLMGLLDLDYYLSVILGALSAASFITLARVFVGKA